MVFLQKGLIQRCHEPIHDTKVIMMSQSLCHDMDHDTHDHDACNSNFSSRKNAVISELSKGLLRRSSLYNHSIQKYNIDNEFPL